MANPVAKPLEWRDTGGWWYADTALGHFTVGWENHPSGWVLISHGSPRRHQHKDRFPTLEAAKAAAQDIYELNVAGELLPKIKRRPVSYDPACLALAEHFDMDGTDADELAQEIQRTVEDFLADKERQSAA